MNFSSLEFVCPAPLCKALRLSTCKGLVAVARFAVHRTSTVTSAKRPAPTFHVLAVIILLLQQLLRTQWGAEQPSSSSSFAKDAKGVTTLQVFKRLLRSFASRASLLICPRATDFRGGEGEREPFNLCILQKNETYDMININKMYLSHKVAENSATVVFRKLSSEISSENSAVS